MKQAAIVAALLSLAIVSVSQSPNKKGIAKQNGTLNTSQPSAATKTQQHTTSPPPSEAVSGPSQPIKPPIDNAITKHPDENIEIQRQIAKFTRDLVWVGIVQGIVFLGTLLVINRQASIMKDQTRSAAIEVVRLNRAYLSVDTWMRDEYVSVGAVGIKVRIYNPSRTAVRIESIEYACDNSSIHLASTPPEGRMLTPKEDYWSHIYPRSLLHSGDSRNASTVSFTIQGRITYTDIFHRTRYRTFAKLCRLGETEPTFRDAYGVGWNEEEGWDKDD